MGRHCTVCIHQDRAGIEHALANNTNKLADIALQFGISTSALSRHGSAHTRPASAGASITPAYPATASPFLIDRLQALYKTTVQILADPERVNPNALKAIARLETQCMLMHRLDPTGTLSQSKPDFDPSPILSHFDVVFQRFPECRQAILEHAESMKGQHSPEAPLPTNSEPGSRS